MSSVFAPGTGFAQSTYKDQMGSALPGQLVYASDVRLVDSYIVDPAIGSDGLEAGIGFVASAIPADQREGSREGMNMFYASLPGTSSTASDFEGITVRNQQMDTNASGHACWFANRACNAVRAKRIGGRIWVQLTNGAATVGEAPNWIVSDTTGHGKPIGSFSGVAITGDTVALTNAVFKSNVDAASGFSIAIVELAEEA